MRVLISAMILADGVDPHEATTRAAEGWTSERIAELKGCVIGSCGSHVVITVPEERADEWNAMVRQLDLEEVSFRETVRTLDSPAATQPDPQPPVEQGGQEGDLIGAPGSDPDDEVISATKGTN